MGGRVDEWVTHLDGTQVGQDGGWSYEDGGELVVETIVELAEIAWQQIVALTQFQLGRVLGRHFDVTVGQHDRAP